MNSISTDTTIQHSGGHLRVHGPPASGKTSLLVERFHWLEGQGRRVAVITYGRSRQEQMTERLLARQSARLGRVPVWTFPRLAREVLAAAEPGLRGPLREVQEMVLLDRVLADIDGGLESDYRTISASAAFRRAVLEVVHTLLQNGVSIEGAQQGMDVAGSERARDLLRVLAGFRVLLEERGMTTFYDAPWRAASSLTESVNPLSGYDALLIDDFGDIDAGQFELLRAAAPPGGSIEVSVFGDPSGARFGYRGTSERFLNDEFPGLYTPSDVTLSVEAAPPRLYGQEQLGLFDTPHRPGGKAAGVVVEATAVYCEDEIAEARMIAERAANVLAAGEYGCRDIAVIVREPRLYARVLAAAFLDRGVPLETGLRGHYAIDDYVGAWLGLLTTGVDERSALRLASSPLYARLRAHAADEAGLGERRAGGDERDVRDIVRWAKKKFPRGGAFSMERFIERVVRPVLAPTAGESRNIEALSHLIDEWGRYVEMLDHVGGKPDLASFRRVLASSAPGRSVARDRARVQLLSPLEATGQSFAVVFVAGCSEGIFPIVESGPGYIPFADLVRAVPAPYPFHFHAARARDEKLHDEQLLFDSAVSRARKTLVLSAPRSFDAAKVAAPSYFVRDAFADADTVHRRESTAVRAARAVADAGAGTFPAAADAPDAVTPVEAIWLSPRGAAAAFRIEAFPMSPSRLSAYDDCPRKLFYDRVLGMKDDGSIYLTVGSLFHTLMENVGAKYPTRDAIVASLTDDVIAKMVDEVCAGERELGRDDSIMNVAARRYLCGLAAEFREMEKSRVGDYRIGAIELDEAYQVGNLSFAGKIDRVDEAGDRAVVIDYKTGKIHRTGKSIRECALGERSGSRHWQIPMYTYGVADKTGRWPYAFCYYVFPPDEDPVMVGLFIGTGKPDTKEFADVASNKFDSISPDELQALMTEVAGTTEAIFGERGGFERTDDIRRCKNCFFKRLCMRYDA